jgi:4-diphosphocytidyl-2-C-methyl-D-erythritol kinase
VRLGAPGKVNLGLRILGRRSDGFHLLDSLFLPIELADELEIRLTPGRAGLRFELEGEPASDVPRGDENLAVRAARAFLTAANAEPGLEIRLDKRLPSAAGLGGGSSDAGAVLRGLAALLPGRLPGERLAELALELGADVPFFLDPRPARVTGIGERIEPLGGIRSWPILLARGGPPLPTSQVFAAYDADPSLTPAGPDPTIRPLWALREDRGLVRAGPQLRGLLRNDLEPAATRLNPAVAELQREIEKHGALAAAMSGSGPTVYGLFEDEGRAREAEREVRERNGAETWLSRTQASP